MSGEPHPLALFAPDELARLDVRAARGEPRAAGHGVEAVVLEQSRGGWR